MQNLADLLKNSEYGLNALKNQINTLKVVKSIQKGTATFSGKYSDNKTITVTIGSVTPSRCIVLLNPVVRQGDSADSFTRVFNAALKQLTSNQLTFSIVPNDSYSNSYYKIDISWQILEFY